MKFCTEEAEAKNKTCHLSIGVNPVYGADGHGIMQGGPYGCLGSSCMAWRWVRTHINNPDGGGMIPSDDTHGYCGLAGHPAQP